MSDKRITRLIGPDHEFCSKLLQEREQEIIELKARRAESIPIADIEAQIVHIKQNGLDVAAVGGEMKDEGRCRELCSMYLQELIVAHRMKQHIDATNEKAEDE